MGNADLLCEAVWPPRLERINRPAFVRTPRASDLSACQLPLSDLARAQTPSVPVMSGSLLHPTKPRCAPALLQHSASPFSSSRNQFDLAFSYPRVHVPLLSVFKARYFISPRGESFITSFSSGAKAIALFLIAAIVIRGWAAPLGAVSIQSSRDAALWT